MVTDSFDSAGKSKGSDCIGVFFPADNLVISNFLQAVSKRVAKSLATSPATLTLYS